MAGCDRELPAQQAAGGVQGAARRPPAARAAAEDAGQAVLSLLLPPTGAHQGGPGHGEQTQGRIEDKLTTGITDRHTD